MNFPNEMSGTHPLAGWCNKLLRAAKASRVSNGIGYKTRIGSDGTILEVDAGGKAAGTSSPSSVKMHRVYSFQPDYLVCREWDGVTLGSADVLIAKPPILRNVSSATIDGTTVTYTYDASTLIRSASVVGFTPETHVIVPRYKVGDIIFAGQSVNGTNTNATLVDLNVDGRAWARAAS
jgi:hypothetical protein